MTFKGAEDEVSSYTVCTHLQVENKGKVADLLLNLGAIHFRRWQIFTIFDPYPPTIGILAKCL